MLRSPHVRRLAVVALTGLTLTIFATPGQSQQQTENGTTINDPEHPLLRVFRWRSIGPTGQGGRVDDIAVRPDNPYTFFVGFATGGLWKTTNNGTTFKPVFDTYGTHSIGALAIAPSNPDVLYVGTGESNNRQSSSFGEGMYKSEDDGETFRHIGLRETQSIARIVVHPTDPDVVWVAANGHLFGENEERGIYKTTDGGATWQKVLYVDEHTGATDIVLDPSDPNMLFAATYQRQRSACCFAGGGPGSGLWRSDDGGDSWNRIEGNGLPLGTMGRIALAMTPADPDMVYAQIEVAADRQDPLSQSEMEEWQRLDDVDSLPPDPEWNGIWRSSDKGQTWEFRSNENGRPMYFSQLRVSPEDPDLVYVVDQRVHKSRDGGRSFETLNGYGHVDQHAVWIDPADHNHIMIGNDGAVDVTYDQGETWESLRSWANGQPYHTSVSMERPYLVCTGLQDNGSWCGPSTVRVGDILSQDWFRVGGGDGFYTAVDPTDPTLIYSESQNGNLRRINMRTGETQRIRPRPPTPDNDSQSNIVPAPAVGTEIRWNWNTPFALSPHNPHTIYLGGNRLFISRDRGEHWSMSPDLSKDVNRDGERIYGIRNSVPRCRQLDRGIDCVPSRNDGVSMWSAIVSLAESPVVSGVLWVGTDDGNIQVSRDGGATWKEVSRNLPGGRTRYYVSRVEASYHDAGTAYVSIDGHKSDDLKPYVYVTRNYGEHWADISANLPEYGNVNTIRQDPSNPHLLYVGTEFGVFVSLDEGFTWDRFMPNLPVVRIDDILVHPRENDLILATHGRSVWIMDDVTALQAMNEEVMASTFHLFPPREAVRWKQDLRQRRAVTGDKNWAGQNAPAGTAIQYHLANAGQRATIRIIDLITGDTIRDIDGPAMAGLNRVQWDLRENPEDEDDNQGPLVEPGVYRVVVQVGGMERTATIDVLEDVWMRHMP
ncbi:MAG: hypothetical protein O7I93_11400 [Gemmatimonadetes bacterium]|nr:hypothetical protein [Gemmatimonadota bacterium]